MACQIIGVSKCRIDFLHRLGKLHCLELGSREELFGHSVFAGYDPHGIFGIFHAVRHHDILSPGHKLRVGEINVGQYARGRFPAFVAARQRAYQTQIGSVERAGHGQFLQRGDVFGFYKRVECSGFGEGHAQFLTALGECGDSPGHNGHGYD